MVLAVKQTSLFHHTCIALQTEQPGTHAFSRLLFQLQYYLC